MSIEKHLDLLGLEVKDKVTDFAGIVCSISFDLFGCIQADVRPKDLNKDGKMKSGWWLDINRLAVINNEPIMKKPNFKNIPVLEYDRGAKDKPIKGY